MEVSKLMTSFVASLWLSAALLLVSCVNVKEGSAHKTLNAPLTSGPEFYAVGFKQGHPIGNEKLLEAVADPDASVEAMGRNAELINRVKVLRFVVVGTTDNAECEGDACSTLSYRRALLVRNWLVENGVPSSRLTAPVGQGNPMPMGYKSTEEERLVARSVRVEIELAP